MEAKNSFEVLLEQLAQDEATLGVAIEDVDPRSRPGHEILKRQAGERIALTKRRFSEEIKGHAFAVFLIGDADKQVKFADIAEDEGDTLTIDSQALYTRITTDLYPTMGNSKEFTSHQISFIMQTLAKVCTELNVVGYPPLKNLVTTYATTFEGAAGLVKDLIRRSMGDELNKLYIEHLTTQKAIAERYTNSVVPVVLLNATQDEIPFIAPTLFNGTYLTISVDEQGSDKNAVIKTFNTIKKVLKEKQSN
jgi:hypothetical protein